MKKMMLGTIVILVTVNPTPLLAESCQQYQGDIKRINNLLLRGGNQSEQRQRKKQIAYFSEELTKCEKRNGISRSILVAQGQPAKKKKGSPKKKPVDAPAKSPAFPLPITPKPIENTADKKTASRIKSLKECIKADNRIDEEVKACMEGRR